MQSSQTEPLSKFSGKACLPCMRSKRRCDKGLPACGRCFNKALLCQYSPVRPYTRWPKQGTTAAGGVPREDGVGPCNDSSAPTETTATAAANPFFAMDTSQQYNSQSQFPGCSSAADLVAFSSSSSSSAREKHMDSAPSLDSTMNTDRSSADMGLGGQDLVTQQIGGFGNGAALCPWTAQPTTSIGTSNTATTTGEQHPDQIQQQRQQQQQQQQQQQLLQQQQMPQSTAPAVLPIPKRIRIPDYEPTRATNHKGIIKAVGQWLRDWANDGHCAFIHRQLYAECSTDSVLQDAFGCFLSYLGKTDENENLVWQLIQRRADSLFDQEELKEQQQQQNNSALSMGDSPARRPDYKIGEWLPKIQAALLYQYMRLFDGDVRQRSLAEQHNAAFVRWLKQLAVEADLFTPSIIFGNSDAIPYGGNLNNDAAESVSGSSGSRASADFYPLQTVQSHWQRWVLSESTRRTWIVAIYLQSIFTTMRNGQMECYGSVAFTLRKGLWDAKSALDWAAIMKSQGALFTEAAPADQFYQVVSPNEVDTFAATIINAMRIPQAPNY